MNDHLVVTREVKLNRIGFDRFNEHRAKKKLKPLKESEVKLAPVGKEVVGTRGGVVVGSEVAASVSAAAVGVLPPRVDNSALKYFPPIRSQESLGSCAQFASIYYTLTYMTALARNWDAKNGGDQFRFSPKWTYNMVNGGNDQGSWFAFDIPLKHGAVTWLEFPYDNDYRAWCLDPMAWRRAINVRADQSGTVSNLDTPAGLAQIKQLLANGYVLNFATYVYSWLWKPISNDPSTTADDAFVGQNCCYQVNGDSGPHAMTVVGYNDDVWVDINGNGVVDPGEKGAFRIANSWGPYWQEGGFTWFLYSAVTNGGWWFQEAYWVTAKGSYTPTYVGQVTVNHDDRNQLNIMLGTSSQSGPAPTTFWRPTLLFNQGGPYAFDGSSTACNGSFYFDYSDIAPSSPTALRWHVQMSDSVTDGNAGLLSGLSLFKTGSTNRAMDQIWFDDALPPGAVTGVDGGDSWSWVSSPTPVSGTLAHQSALRDGEHQHAFINAKSTITPQTGDSLFVYVYLDSALPPDELMLQWMSNGSWEHRAYWGFNVINWGVTGTASRYSMGAMPAKGKWVRLEIPAKAVGLENARIDGMAFTLFNGKATWDAAGVKTSLPDSLLGTAANVPQLEDGSVADAWVDTANPEVINAPGNLKASVWTFTVGVPIRIVAVTWTDNSSNETGFLIERATVNGNQLGPFQQVGQVAQDATTYLEIASPGRYVYRVRAVDAATGVYSKYSSVFLVTVQ